MLPPALALAAGIASKLNAASSILPIVDPSVPVLSRAVMGESAPDFGALMQARGEPDYAAFDLVWLNGRDLRELPFTKRKARLRRLLAG